MNRRAVAILILAGLLAGCGGGERTLSGTNVAVTGAGPTAPVQAGRQTAFRMTVANRGPNVASQVRIVNTVGNQLALNEITCSASGGAACPDPAGVSMLVPTMPVGAVLEFEVRATVTLAAGGTLTNTMTATIDDDISRSDNTATATAVVDDTEPSEGAYKVYAADGREYVIVIDFAAQAYTISGDGVSAQRTFTADGDGTLVVSESVKFRTGQDVIVGLEQFGDAVLPYVGGRLFVGSVDAVGGNVNIMARNVAPGGSPASTRAATARISGNVLQICDDDFEVVQPQFCSVGSLRSYTLTVSDDVFTATAAAPEFPSFDFRVARMGSSNVMLAAGPSSLGAPETGTLQLLIGLPESAGLLDSTAKGPAVGTTGASDWVTVQVTRATYASLGASINDVAGLSRPGVESPFSMLNGNPLPTLGGAPIWVMQSYPLIVVSGSFLGSPSASGLLQLGLP